uniref:C2H2-type domain-containing protein n=1 Tax=Oncorhynchus tshawytscha TaxID=74940 RepID=A0A8C8JUK2_ONCTS
MPESRYHWSGDEVNAIVSIWSDEAIQRALRSSDSEYRGAAKVYHEIFVRLRKLGYKGTVQQCRDKLKKLKGQYKEIKSNGPDRRSYFPPSWFDAMDAVLGQRLRKPVLRSDKATVSQKNDKLPSSWTPDELPQTSGSGVRTSASRLLELTDSSEEYEESGYHWSSKEVQALLTLWADKIVQKHLLSYKNEHVYAKFSSELAALGFKRTSKQCRQKIQILKKEHKKIKDNNNMSGSIYREENWFAIIDSVLCHQPRTLESGVINSDAKLLGSPDSQQEMGDSNKSPSIWTPDEVHGQQSETSGLGVINATNLLFESTPDSPVDEEHIEESGYHWSPKEIQALLTLWADGSVQKQLLSYKNEHVYAKFSSELAALGFNRKSKQCRDKLKKLKQEYRRVKDDNNKSGSNHRGERWFAIIDSVLCHQPSTLESGVIQSDAMLLELTQPNSPQEVEDSDQSAFSWTPHEVHGLVGHQPGTSGAEVIHSATMLLELTQPDSPVKEEPYEKSGYSWTSQEVHALLTLWADESVQEQLLTYKNEHVYATFSSELAVLGFKKTSRQCRDKLKKLRQEYRQIKFDHNKRGSNHCRERWFAIMDRVLCHQPSTVESGVINSDAKILELPDSQQEMEDSDQSSSSWTPDEVRNLFGHQTGSSGAEVINSATMLLESTQSYSPEVEDYEESGYHWTMQEVHTLLTLWADETVQKQLLSYKNEHVYAKFSSEFAALGFNRTSKQCREKLKKLKQEYRKLKDDDNMSGSIYLEESCFSIIDSVLTNETKAQAYSFPGAEDFGPGLTLSSLRLLAPPLRLMSAFMWKVAQQHIVKHYGKLEEFVTLVTEMVPELLSSRQRTQLLLGLRARLVLELCLSESTADLVTIQPHLDKIHYLTEYAVHKESNDDELEATESNFVELVQTLLEDPSEREHFFQEVFPARYGPQYDTALQVLVWEFLSRLEELLPVPDFTQTAAWLGDAPSVVEECGSTIFDTEELKTLLQHHQHHGNLKRGLNSDMESQVLACSLCSFSHSDMAKLHQHIRIRHRGEDRKLRRPKESGTEKHLPSSRTKLLHQHIRTRHQGDEQKCQHSEESGTENLPSSTTIIPYRPNNMTLSCPHCGNVYQNLNSLKKHIRIHTFPFCCNQCERRFSTRLGLKRHQRAHTEERPFKCSHCDRRFMCAYSLKMHVRTHTGERPYTCTICGKTSVQHLARHMRMHAGEKNYLCSICGKAFLSSGELRLHTRSHTGECPYTCEHCRRGFKAACHLQIHIRRFHTGERPYPCTLCTKRFVILRELKRHMLIHTGEKGHKCSECGKSFSLKESLKTHLKSHGF